MPKASLSEDALLRILVTAIAETIARLALLRTAGQFAQAQQQIDQDLEELLGLKADLARQLSDQKIVEMLTTNEFLDVGRLYYVAELFRQEAEILKVQGQNTFAQISQARALNLFLEVGFAVENDFLEADERIDELFDDLGADTPEETLFTLFDYYEQVGAFARAAAAINLMLEKTENDPGILSEKRAFFERLLTESDAELEAGELPREEIERQLQQMN
jgi:hypothetical protein